MLTPALAAMGTVKLASVEELVDVWLYKVAALNRLILVQACSNTSEQLSLAHTYLHQVTRLLLRWPTSVSISHSQHHKDARSPHYGETTEPIPVGMQSPWKAGS